MLTSKQRSNLRSIAQKIQPITQVGKLGVNDALIDSLDKAIEHGKEKRKPYRSQINAYGNS